MDKILNYGFKAKGSNPFRNKKLSFIIIVGLIPTLIFYFKSLNFSTPTHISKISYEIWI